MPTYSAVISAFLLVFLPLGASHGAQSAVEQSVQVYTTAKDTQLRLTLSDTLKWRPAHQPIETEIAILVDKNRKFQQVLGFGGAITDASAEVFSKLSSGNQQKLVEAYFGETGLQYSLLRTTIHSSDFGSGSYTYITEGDKTLSTFSIAHDLKYRIPLIKRALEKADNKLLIYASPWSPPAFMKSNGSMLQGGSLLPEYFSAWAKYYVKFIEAFESAGVPIWGVTIQNEPMATQRWESNIVTAEQERDFLKKYLGPEFSRSGLADKKIIVWDHNRDLMAHRAQTIFNDPEAARYAWGIGYHWYEVWTGSEPNTANLRDVYQAYPDKPILFTEGTIEAFDPEKLQYWPNAERYGRDMVNDFNAGVVGWTDWNILLDQRGGPNHVGNFCFAPIHANIDTDELIFTPTYYYLGHFSKFVKPGAVRVSSSVSQSFLRSVSFVNPDGGLVSLVLNLGDTPQKASLYLDEQQLNWLVPARSIQTLVF